MIVDTSVWINHFRRPNADLEYWLESSQVITHPFVIGELACGSLSRRSEVLRLIEALPSAPVASHDEVIAFIERNHLQGLGLGWIDVHLLASARLGRCSIWSADGRMREAALRLKLAGPE